MGEAATVGTDRPEAADGWAPRRRVLRYAVPLADGTHRAVQAEPRHHVPAAAFPGQDGR